MTTSAQHKEALARQLERVEANPESSEIARDGARSAKAGMAEADCPHESEHAAALWKIGFVSAKKNTVQPE